MKSCFIIGTYPNSKRDLDILEQCIDAIVGYDIILTSHYYIPEYIQKKVKCVIYDSENALLSPDLSPTMWVRTDDIHFEFNCNSHNLSILRNVKNGLVMAKHLGYDFFYYGESDNILNKQDLDKLHNYKLIMENNNKKMIFFEIDDNDYQGIDTLLFGGVIDIALNEIPLPMTEEEYRILGWVGALESMFYLHFKRFNNDDKFILKGRVSDFLNKSEINKTYKVAPICLPLFNNTNTGKVTICAYNCTDIIASYILYTKEFEIKLKLEPQTYWYQDINPDILIGCKIEYGEFTKETNFNDINLLDMSEIEYNYGIFEYIKK